MRKVDMLLLKVQEAQKLDSMQVATCLVLPAGDKWQAMIDLWDGVDYPNGRSQRLILETDTKEEALAARDEVKAVHAPTGYRANTMDCVTILFG